LVYINTQTIVRTKSSKKNMETKPTEMTEEQKKVLAQIIANTANITCKCGNDIFTQGRTMKRLPRQISGAKNDQFLQFPIMYCIKCNEEVVLQDMPEPENIIKLNG